MSWAGWRHSWPRLNPCTTNICGGNLFSAFDNFCTIYFLALFEKRATERGQVIFSLANSTPRTAQQDLAWFLFFFLY